MEILERDIVRMKDRSAVEKKLQELMTGGPSKLQVISDFDYTITRAHKDGVKYATTHDILTQTSLVPEEYRRQSKQLFNYYYTIAADPNLSSEEKISHMVEWYNKEQELMPTSGIVESDVPEIVKASNVCLREGCEVLFDTLHKHDVPVLVFSAGVVDILQEVLKQHNVLRPNTKFIANYFDFDEKSKLRGFKGRMILPFNKNWTAVGDKDYFDSLKSRNNIILMGDSLGDTDMSDGAENVNVILKIGFLNSKVDAYLSYYLDAFDIVITDDQTMDVVNGLLQNILG